jgi:hypothetical protein
LKIETRTSSRKLPSGVYTVPNLIVYPSDCEAVPDLIETTSSTNFKESGPLILITEIAPVPGIVAGAMMVSKYRLFTSSEYLIIHIG